MKQEQAHVYYSGTVQGVGFRYQVRTIANAVLVCGWVRNLPDGRVELIAEAEKQDLLGFLERIDQSLGQYISDKQISWGSPEGCFKGFKITF